MDYSHHRTKVFGWVIAGTILGAGIADFCSQLRPLREGTMRGPQAWLEKADRRIPFVMVGCLVGAVLGRSVEWILAAKRQGKSVFAYTVILVLVAIVFVLMAIP